MTRLTILMVAPLVLPGCQRLVTPASPTAETTPSPALNPETLAPVEGEYKFTVTADSSCDQLPPSLRSRTYNATVTREGRQIVAELTGADFYPGYSEFWIRSTGPTHAQVTLMSAYAWRTWLDDVPLLERLSSGGYIGLMGSGGVPFNGSVPVTPTTLSGEYSYCPTPVEQAHQLPPLCPQPVTCRSATHTLNLTRR